jgi:hypothetical protein
MRLNPMNYSVEATGMGMNGGNIKVRFEAPTIAPFSTLSPDVAATFDAGQYAPRVLENELIVYRSEGRQFGRWFGIEKPDSAAQAERLFNLIDYSHEAVELSMYRIPKGTVIYEGKVAGGIGHQVYIPNPRRSGVKLLSTEQLPQGGF